MTTGTVDAALTALTDLVETARMHRDVAVLDGWPGTAQRWAHIANQLDAARTRLIQADETDDVGIAWAFVDAGRLTIARELARRYRRSA